LAALGWPEGGIKRKVSFGLCSVGKCQLVAFKNGLGVCHFVVKFTRRQKHHHRFAVAPVVLTFGFWPWVEDKKHFADGFERELVAIAKTGKTARLRRLKTTLELRRFMLVCIRTTRLLLAMLTNFCRKISVNSISFGRHRHAKVTQK